MTARIFTLSTCILMFAAAGRGAETLPQLISRLDAASATFTGMTAQLKQLDHTEVLGENEVQTAAVKLKKTKAGVVARVDFNEPNVRVFHLKQRTVEIFVPKSNTVQIYDVGKFGQKFDQFLLLGFGISGKELQQNYSVKLLGQENIGNRPATHIELVPKSKEALEYVKRFELWIALDAAYPLQEKVHKNSTDYILVTYTDVKLNAPLTDQDVELKLPAGVSKMYPNK